MNSRLRAPGPHKGRDSPEYRTRKKVWIVVKILGSGVRSAFESWLHLLMCVSELPKTSEPIVVQQEICIYFLYNI